MAEFVAILSLLPTRNSNILEPMTRLLLALILVATTAIPADKPALRYTKDGEMLYPADYREWIFLSAGLGMTYAVPSQNGHPNFDNVFVDPASYKAFQRTGQWPDKTVLILEVRASNSQVSINKGGSIQDKVLAVEVHAKDQSRGGWSFYAFEPGHKQSKRIPQTANCYSCHEQHGALDTTFTQFYPTLSEAAQRAAKH